VQFPEIAGVGDLFSVFSRHEIPIGRTRSPAYPGVRFVFDLLPLTGTSNVANESAQVSRPASAICRYPTISTYG
jgi:hypothetical protein